MSQASWRDVDDLEYAATVADDGRTACVDGKAQHGKERFGFGEEWVHWDVDLADESITEAEQELAGASPGLCAGTFATLRMYDAVSFIAKQSPTTKAAFEEDPRLVATTVAAWRLDGQRICVATTEDGEISTDTGYILVSTTETGKHVEDDDSVTINSDDPACTEPPAGTAPLVAIEELAEDSDEEDATADACRSFPDMPGCENN